MRNVFIFALMYFVSVSSALASPFCVRVQGVSPQCDYVDASQCRQRATQLGGDCVANEAELTVRSGTGKYCVVDSNKTSICSYDDRITCDNDAIKMNGVCIESDPEAVLKDPFAADPNRKY